MKQADLEEIWVQICTETLNRKEGSFQRAFWFGGRSLLAKKVFEKGKGFRKTVRHSPKHATKLISLVSLIVVSIVATPAGGVASAVAVDQSLDLTYKVVKIGIGKLFQLFKIGADIAVKEGGGAYYQHKIKNLDSEDLLLRQKIVLELKDIKKNGLLTIDRNLVKMRSAIKDIPIKFDNLEQAILAVENTDISSPEDDIRVDPPEFIAAEAALRAVAEANYYVVKLKGLSVSMVTAFTKVIDDLDTLEAELEKERAQLARYIMQNID
jgi:hypothetical protein